MRASLLRRSTAVGAVSCCLFCSTPAGALAEPVPLSCSLLAAGGSRYEVREDGIRLPTRFHAAGVEAARAGEPFHVSVAMDPVVIQDPRLQQLTVRSLKPDKHNELTLQLPRDVELVDPPEGVTLERGVLRASGYLRAGTITGHEVAVVQKPLELTLRSGEASTQASGLHEQAGAPAQNTRDHAASVQLSTHSEVLLAEGSVSGNKGGISATVGFRTDCATVPDKEIHAVDLGAPASSPATSEPGTGGQGTGEQGAGGWGTGGQDTGRQGTGEAGRAEPRATIAEVHPGQAITDVPVIEGLPRGATVSVSGEDDGKGVPPWITVSKEGMLTAAPDAGQRAGGVELKTTVTYADGTRDLVRLAVMVVPELKEAPEPAGMSTGAKAAWIGGIVGLLVLLGAGGYWASQRGARS